MKNILFGCKIVSCLMVFTVILHLKVAVLPFQLILHQPDIIIESMSFIIITGLLFLMLNLIAAIGLFSVKKWSFTFSYLAIICSTLTGISYIPLTYKTFYKFFLSHPSIIPIILINLVILSYVIYLDISYRKTNEQSSQFIKSIEKKSKEI